jgi:3-dehydro-4-phosphotetronate decarboxylase
MSEDEIRESIVRWGKSLFDRGLTSGSSGNISARVAGGYIATPTNSCLGFLDPERLAILDGDGRHIAGDPPTKELPLHLGVYRNRPSAAAVVHLHSTFSTALSCLADTDPLDAIPPITPYAVMRLGRVPVIPYARPGAPEAETLIAEKAGAHVAMLLRNHGPIVAGETLDAAVFAIEELEEAAKLVFMTRAMPLRLLDDTAVNDLTNHFPRSTHA